MLAEDVGIGRPEEAPGSGIAIVLGEDVILGVAGAAEDLAGVVGDAARRRAEGLADERLDEPRPRHGCGREVRGRQRGIERFEQKSPRGDLGHHLLDGAELANGVARFLVVKEARELHAARGVRDGAAAEHVGHAEADRGEVGRAQHGPEPANAVVVHRGAFVGQGDAVQRTAASRRRAGRACLAARPQSLTSALSPRRGGKDWPFPWIKAS